MGTPPGQRRDPAIVPSEHSRHSNVLREIVRSAVSGKQFTQLSAGLTTLGEKIFRWMLAQLRGARLGDAHAEAEDLFQNYCLRVLGSVRRVDGQLTEGWFWAVARTCFLNPRFASRDRDRGQTDEVMKAHPTQREYFCQDFAIVLSRVLRVVFAAP